MKLFKILVLLLNFAAPAFACKPVAGAKSKTLEENFKIASQVFWGKVSAQTELAKKEGTVGIPYELQFEVEKSWKGEPPARVKASTNSNTCNAFGQFAEVGSKCLVLLNSKGEVISGVPVGEASQCWFASDPDSKKKFEEMDARLRKAAP